MEHFITQSDIYPGFTGKVSTLTNFPLKPDCEDYFSMDQAVKDFEHGLDSILTDPVDPPELDVSFDDVMPCLLQCLQVFCTQ